MGLEPRKKSAIELLAEQEQRRIADMLAAEPLLFSEMPGAITARNLVYVGLDNEGRLVSASAPAEHASRSGSETQDSGGALSSPSTAVEPYPLLIQVLGEDGSSTEHIIADVQVPFPKVQPIPGGGLLIVGARSSNLDSGPQRNAFVYGPTGSLTSSFCIGDGVADIQVTATGQLWASYFDEGIFGRGPASERLGRSGLVRWSLTGQRDLEFQPPDGFDPMADCYALSVAGEEAWACYYQDFPIVRIDQAGSVTGWQGRGVGGVRALAIDNQNRVGLVGGHGAHKDRLVLIDLAADPAPSKTSTYKLMTPEATDLPTHTRLLARGKYVNAIFDQRWLQLDLAKVPHQQ